MGAGRVGGEEMEMFKRIQTNERDSTTREACELYSKRYTRKTCVLCLKELHGKDEKQARKR